MENIACFATAPNGVADLLAAEMRALGAASVAEARAGVRFEGTLETAYRACLWSRVANRILLPLTEFPAGTSEALYDGTFTIDWSQHLRADQTLAVDANVSDSTLNHSHYVALRIKDAIVDQFQAREGVRPSVDTDRPDIRINCYIHRDIASVYLDLSGASLHRRSYRGGAGEAPLKENLAAAILMRCNWPEVAKQHGAFVDLMCGSGTLAIEAALIAADMAPGLSRDHFGFLGWQGHVPVLWRRLVEEAQARREKGLATLPPILGFDYDRRVLTHAKENAHRAGLEGKVTFAYQDIFQFRHSFPAFGLMATNPPYGRRMLESGELPRLYAAIGNVLKEHMRGWRAAVFTEDAELGKAIGIRADKLHSLFNGAVPCKLIHFSVDEKNFFADARIPRIIERDAWSEQAHMFANRLDKNRKQVEKWSNREHVNCYRVYDADLPDFSAAVDVYQIEGDPDAWLVVQEYEAPASIDPAKAKLRTRELVSVVQACYEATSDHIVYKTRSRQRGESQYTRLAGNGEFHVTREGPCRFLVNFEDYIDTGLFLDHRPMRQRIAAEASGKDFLNLFCYTGAATVHAALGGAKSTTSVDMSNTFLEWARRNLEANHLAGNAHRLIQSDCLSWLKAQKGAQYDLIFLDPPTFSNSKRMSDVFDVQKDHAEIIRMAMRLLRPGGTLYFSTNLRQFRLDATVGQAFEARDISAQSIPFDFKRRKNIHQCWQIRQPQT